MFLVVQANGVSSSSSALNFQRHAAALALALNIRDEEEIKAVYPAVDYALQIAQESIKNGTSIFGSGGPYFKLEEKFGSAVMGALPAESCNANVDEFVRVSNERGYIKIVGQLKNIELEANTPLMLIGGQQPQIAGYFVLSENTNLGRSDRSSIEGYSDFIGYINEDSMLGRSDFAVHDGEGYWCNLRVERGELPFHLEEGEAEEITVTSAKVVKNDNWHGSDFYKTQKPGYIVLGSYITSDSDKGSIALELDVRDKLMYRGGPSSEGQEITIIRGEKVYENVELPMAEDWKILAFDINSSSVNEIKVVFHDRGRGWGQWSAIMLREE